LGISRKVKHGLQSKRNGLKLSVGGVKGRGTSWHAVWAANTGFNRKNHQEKKTKKNKGEKKTSIKMIAFCVFVVFLTSVF
jgi:hypothetical protein